MGALKKFVSTERYRPVTFSITWTQCLKVLRSVTTVDLRKVPLRLTFEIAGELDLFLIENEISLMDVADINRISGEDEVGRLGTTISTFFIRKYAHFEPCSQITLP